MKAKVVAHRDFHIGRVDDRIYGSFLEHMGRAIYSGIYEPDHPTADANGMRGDVMALVRELNTPVCRYPGGNFVSAHNWEDGVGPKEARPRRLDLAWHTTESNQVGLHEFAGWCEAVGTEMMLAVNLGSRGLDAARALLEYCNHPGGSAWSEMRRRNGRAKPFGVRLWCLGNEMDGPWQIGHKTAEEYGRLANETGKAMRAYDKSLELVVCGSSSSGMRSFPAWEATVLEHTFEIADHISLHMYFDNRKGHTGNFLALNRRLEDYIDTVAGTIRHVKAKTRSARDVHISFDEWNVWYHSDAASREQLEGRAGWPEAPALLEDVYNFEDVLMTGCILNSFIRRADVVKIACIAQLVNVIAPILTECGGRAWRQTIFYPLMLASRHGRGRALNLALDGPTYDAESGAEIPCLDIAAVEGDDGVVSLFAINRHPNETLDAAIELAGFGAPRLVAHQTIHHADLNAVNTADNPTNVVPVEGKGAAIEDGVVYVRLPPYSWHLIRVATR